MALPILAIDTETTGLFDKKLAIDAPEQPHILQLGAVLFAGDGSVVTRIDGLLIKPRDDWHLARKAEEVHGISLMKAKRYGVDEVMGLGLIVNLARTVRTVVGHGIEFDRDVIVSCLMRLGKSPELIRRPGLEWIDTMKIATQVCQLPGILDDGSFKYPKLSEASEHLLGKPQPTPHSAGADAALAGEIFFKLREMGLIEGHSA
jgi:DNA polymerase III epsilon subunit-like protein